MKAGKSNQEEDEFEEEDFISNKEGPSSTSISNINSITKDAKNNDKANAIRSKHSVTEQRRRSKINERFQMLRDLIPHSDQKRDTASFLVEVIEYVQYLQEKVQKYEGSYPIWNGEPSKLMPWRNSHWRVQSFASQSPTINNGSFPGLTFLGKVDDNNNPVAQNLEDSLANRGVGDISSIGAALQVPMQVNAPSSVRSDGMAAQPLQMPASDAPSTECLVTSEQLTLPEKANIEGGTIRISSPYSEGLLNKLTQALQDAGVDLSQASISIQIDIGKNANKASPSETSVFKDHENNEPTMHVKDGGSAEDSNRARKRLKTRQTTEF